MTSFNQFRSSDPKESTSTRKTIQDSVFEPPENENKFGEDCTCEANLFYKQYKEQIDHILKKHLKDLKSSTTSARGTKKKTATSFKDVRSKDQSVSFKGSQFAQSSFSLEEMKGSIEEEQKSIKEKDEDKDSVICASTWEDLQKLGWDKKSKDIDYFLRQLSLKMDQELFEGEGESMGVTERGYYVFERYSESIEPPDTVCKTSTLPSSVEEEDLFSFHLPYVEEEWMSESMRRALAYLNKHHIAELFRYLGAQLASNKPCNPIDFLINLLDHCMNYRAGFCQPPLLYMPKHIESLFNSMDPMKTGEIDIHQYHTAMLTLGIKNYNHFPELNTNSMVEKETFLNEAFLQLKILLDEMIKSDEPTTISGYTAFYPSIHGGESVK